MSTNPYSCKNFSISIDLMLNLNVYEYVYA